MTRKRKVRWLFIVAFIAYNVAAHFAGYSIVTQFAGYAGVRASLFATYVAGGATGCSLSAAMNVINADLGSRARNLARRSEVIGAEGDLVQHRTPYGDFWSPVGTDVSFLLAEEELDLYRADDPVQGVRPGDIVLDCGANVGTFVRKALAAGASKVAAIEISPRNIEALKKTFAAEIADGRVVVVPEGVWHEDSTLQLSFYKNSALDSVVMRERVDFIKMDIEGAERNALRGAAATLKKFRPRLAIAAENLPDDVSEIPSVVAASVPDYKFEVGECRLLSPGLIRPEVLHFY
ncbi:MAG: FkbM family methyltransferase [Acidobacteria bacterium]|nr:FkbM family methyltransferase [Acidobacteriota bacterium]MDA1237158.1 FkbM family methyltransferase [Acidobacteriota bacterium]